jgi:alkylhydroperoxidase family enzyme
MPVAADRSRDGRSRKSGAAASPLSVSKTVHQGRRRLPLRAMEEAARLGEQLGIERPLAMANVFRALLQSPSATAGFYGVIEALMYRNRVAARTRELVILRVAWRTGAEYVFCHHVRIARDLGIAEEEILGVRDPRRCRAYGKTDRAVLRLADELHEGAEVRPSTWAALARAFAPDELVELLLIGGFWRMVAGFVKSARLPLDAGVPGWPEGREPAKNRQVRG